MQNRDEEVPQDNAVGEWALYEKHTALGPIGFRLRDLPGQHFVLFFPECVTARNADPAWHKPTWDIRGAFVHTTIESEAWALALRIDIAQTRSGPSVVWQYTLDNSGDAPLRDAAAFNCVYLAEAPLFKDLAMERTFVRDADGREIALKDGARTRAPRTLQFYGLAGAPDLGTNALVTHLQALSPQKLSGDRMRVVSTDGAWALETVVDGPVAYFFNNWESDHGCVHAAPLFGTLEPGQSAGAKGSIDFTRL